MTITKLDQENLKKIEALGNKKAFDIIQHYVDLCKPAKITVITDDSRDQEYVRKLALQQNEEKKLAMSGHTIHFDGSNDQGRDKANTCILLPKGKNLSKKTVTKDRDSALGEIFGLLDGIMHGKEMLIAFFCLGPQNSKFSLSALQITDSAYVVHSETILYRQGYNQFKNLNGSEDFFYFIHSAGELNERHNTKNIDQRRIYMDLEENRVFTINNQYAGNSVGLKKLALRLAVNKAHQEGWLCEHMFLMGAKALNKDRITYFTGAFPSACGKTSTAMIPGQTIIGDDMSYLKIAPDGKCHAVNVEQGIFGIIEDVNPIDDPLIYKALTTPRELIFSNILVNEDKPYWLGMGKELPAEGENYCGAWHKGLTNAEGKEILPAHKNARYTIRLKELGNVDANLDNPNGVPVSGIIYGGRDSDTSPPVLESLSWEHGVFIGATLESETTAATIGTAGVRTHDPMANMDFLVVPLGTYIDHHLQFGAKLGDKCPRIFGTNYFLKENDKFLNEKVDKKVWLMWMEGRIHNEYDAIETPIGLIPKYEDLRDLFQQIFNRTYTEQDHEKLFAIRTCKLLERLDRVEAIYKAEENIPKAFFDQIDEQRKRLLGL